MNRLKQRLDLWKLRLARLPHGVLVGIVSLGLISLILVWGETFYDQYAEREAAKAQARTITLGLAIALREHVHGVVSSANQLLERMSEDYLRVPSGPEPLLEWAKQSQFVKETAVVIGIVGADGKAVASTFPNVTGIDFSDREYFRVHHDRKTSKLHIGPPILGRFSGKPQIPISRRIERPDGTFAGVANISLDTTYFAKFFNSVHLGPQGLIWMVGWDGIVRARSTQLSNDADVGHNFSDRPQFPKMRSTTEGNFTTRSVVDGVERIYGFANLAEYQLIVATGMSVDDVLGPRQSSNMARLLVAVGISALIVGLVVLSMRELQQRGTLEEHQRKTQQLEAIGHLTAGVAHDFNNILASIQGYTERLLRGGIDDRQRTFLDGIEKVVKNAERIVGHLLAYSRQQPLQPQTVDINPIVNEVIELTSAVFGDLWTVRCDLEPQLEPATADPAELETALLNVAINARDAMPMGGIITFETRLVASGQKGVPSDLSRGRYVAIRVTDTGPGMSPDTAAKAFDPFFTTKANGTGLGLSQVLGLARQLGGTATIDTVRGSGTTVTIYLPTTHAAPEDRHDSKDHATAAPKPFHEISTTATILVADDNPHLRDAMVSTLKEVGYEVVEARDGATTLEALLHRKFDLAVIDNSMPGMSGNEAYRRAVENGRTVPVLFIGGLVDVGVLNGAPFLSKPFRSEMFKDSVRQLLSYYRRLNGAGPEAQGRTAQVNMLDRHDEPSHLD